MRNELWMIVECRVHQALYFVCFTTFHKSTNYERRKNKRKNILTEKRNVLKDLKSLRADYNEFFKRWRKPSLKFIMKSINLNNKTRKPNNFFCSLSFVCVHFWQHPESSIAMKFTLILKNILFYGHHVISLRWYLFGEHAVWD